MKYISITSVSVFSISSANLRKEVSYITILAFTLFTTFLLGDLSGSKRTLAQDEKRISFLQGIITQELNHFKTRNLVTVSAVNFLEDKIEELKKERDEAVQKYENMMERLYQYSDGSCMVTASARAAKWRLDHVGVWNKILLIQFKMVSVEPSGRVTTTTVGHATFVFEIDGYMWMYSNGGSYRLGKNIPHDPLVIAGLLYGPRLVTAEFEE